MGSTPKCSGSKHKIRQPGNANLRIGKGHVWSMFLEYVAGRISAANLSDCFRHDPLVCQCGDWRSQGKNCLSTSFLPPPVIPAKAGILTRAVIYKSRTIVVNYAGKPFKVRAIFCLSCSLWCGSGRYAKQGVHTLVKIPAFAGMTWGADVTTYAGISIRAWALLLHRNAFHTKVSGHSGHSGLCIRCMSPALLPT